MSNKDMLGIVVRKLVRLPFSSLGIVCDLLEKLSEDPEWVDATKKFLRKENPWVKQWLWRKIDGNTIEVNLDFVPKLPFEGAQPQMWKKCEGVVTVKRVGEDLFVNGRKVTLHLEPEQVSGVLAGSTLRSRIVEMDVLHPNILDALLDGNTHLLPNSLKKNSAGKTQYMFFLALGFRAGDGDLYVRCLYFGGGQWRWCDSWLDSDFDDQNPAVLLAS